MADEVRPDKPFSVVNAGNTCYIDSLLMALFYFPSMVSNVLTREADCDGGGDVMMLQEMIRHQFVLPSRKAQTINGDTMGSLRGMLVEAGWLGHLPEDIRFEEMFHQHDVNELYHFLMNRMRGPTIDINIDTTYPSGDVKNSKISLPFISLSIPASEKDGMVQVKNLLGDYLSEQKKKLHHEGEDTEVKDVCTIDNIPEFIALAVNRYTNITERNETMIDINTDILPFKTMDNYDIKGISYNLHSLVCLRSQTALTGHYYSVLYTKEEIDGKTVGTWYKFDDLQDPCMSKIDVRDGETIHDIASNVVFLLYKSSLV
jgi:uncharacterized UBP type Zn finger protein